MADSLSVFSAADSDQWQRMYLRAIERHHENLDAILSVVALGGDLKNVVRCVVDWLDGMDALADTDHDLLRRAWIAAGGTLGDFPVEYLEVVDGALQRQRYREAVGPGIDRFRIDRLIGEAGSDEEAPDAE